MEKTPIDRAVSRAWWALVARGVLAIALGIFIIARPFDSVAGFALAIALWALIQGAVGIVHAFALRPYAQHWWVMLLSGVVGIVFGVAALYYYPGLSLTFAVVWAAWWLMLGGVFGISIAMQERRAGMPWGWTMAWGVLGVVTSIAAFANPPTTLAALMGLIAAFGIVGGVTLLVGAYRLRTTADTVGAAIRAA